jgi:hypothetical protein
MQANAIYLTSQQMLTIADELYATSSDADSLVELFQRLASRYPGETFKVKLILALKS